MVIGSVAILSTANVAATIHFYVDVLGFASSWTWDDPPSFGSVSWGGAEIMFSLQPDVAANVDGHEHWLNVDHIDDLFSLHLERGAKILSPIEDKPWGRREYTVQDPNGYRLRFGGDPAQAVAPSRPFPEGVRIIRRNPTAQEYEQIAGSAFGGRKDAHQILGSTWQGLVAESPEGEPIGTTRIMFDAPGWYSVWDVAVLPEWQGMRIGEALMKEAIECVREVSPGAFIYLFTFKHGFYERLGFANQTVSMLKV